MDPRGTLNLLTQSAMCRGQRPTKLANLAWGQALPEFQVKKPESAAQGAACLRYREYHK